MHRYVCLQENIFERRRSKKHEDESMQRDRVRMKRYSCESKLWIRTIESTQVINLHMRHATHAPYVLVALPKTIIDYVNNNTDDNPQKLFRSILQNPEMKRIL